MQVEDGWMDVWGMLLDGSYTDMSMRLELQSSTRCLLLLSLCAL
jgi:hypothetical protein